MKNVNRHMFCKQERLNIRTSNQELKSEIKLALTYPSFLPAAFELQISHLCRGRVLFASSHRALWIWNCSTLLTKYLKITLLCGFRITHHNEYMNTFNDLHLLHSQPIEVGGGGGGVIFVGKTPCKGNILVGKYIFGGKFSSSSNKYPLIPIIYAIFVQRCCSSMI